MKNAHSGIATPALIIVVALAFVLAGSYGYAQLSKKERAADDILDSARKSLEHSTRPISEIAAELEREKSRLQFEINRLEIFRQASFNPSSSYGFAISVIQKDLSKSVIASTDSLYKLITVTTIDPALKTQITQERQNLINLIDAWKKALSTPGANQATIAAAADAAIVAAQQYAETLSHIVHDLTPENSDLTQSDINTQQQIVDQVTNTTNQANETIHQIQPNPEVIEEIKDNVNDLEEELEDANQNNSNNNNNSNGNNSNPLENNNNNANNNQNQGGDSGDNNPPFVPPPQENTGVPRLIQGENTY